jgi:class 3 adenylate cyclase/predicted ATPase
MQAVADKAFFFHDYTLDLRRGCLRKADLEIELRPKSFAVLRHLVENAGRLVSKDELIETVWTDVIVTDVSLARCVSDVRLALQDKDQQIIRTVPRRGYLFAAPVSFAASTMPATAEARPERRSGERRQLTVMSCELMGIASLSARLDLEDLGEAMAACHRRCTEIIERHRGYVAHYGGDGLLAYFGYPAADERDAENAVRAALRLQASANQLMAGLDAPVQPRIGIASGIVVIGDDFAAGGSAMRTAVGETVTLSGRLQAMAEPGQIVIAHGTRRLVGGLFEYYDLGEVALKGLAAPVEIAQVLGESGAESRFEASHPTNLAPLVGREEEMDLLLRRWRRAEAGDGSIVLISGEPGIGKSRIAQTVLERLTGARLTRLRLFCSPDHGDSAFYPAIRQLERAAGFQRTDTNDQRLAKLEALLASATGSVGDTVPLLADLLSIRTGDRYPAVALTPQQRRERTLAALVAYVTGLTATRPVLLVVEDMHWADPATLELVDLVVEAAPRLRLLVIVTFRPEFVSPWAGRIQTTPLTLGRLPPRQCAAIIDGVVHGKRLPPEIAAEIIERTDGVPLFVEELTKAVLESGALAEAGDGYTVAGPLPSLTIPMTLRGSLLARLDRLAPVRDVAQIGAALGRRFSHQLIAAVAAMPAQQLNDALARLVSAELIWRRGSPPDAEYTFKHALVQDTAYGTLLREPRRALHARIAQTFETQFPDIADSQPELLAHHYTEAHRLEKAAMLWGKAGQSSLARSGLREAASQLQRAMDQIETLPGTPALRREQIKFQIALANALMHLRGYSAPETADALDKARFLVDQVEALGEPLDDPLALFSVLHGVWVANHVAFDGDAVRTLAVQFMAVAAKSKESFPLVVAHRIMGTSLLFLGDIADSRSHFDQALALYDPPRHRGLATRFGQDAGVAILSNRPLALWLLGDVEAAFEDADDAVAGARELGQAGTLLYALTRIASFHLVAGNLDAAAAQIRELAAVAEDKGGSYWMAAGTMIRGCLLALAGDGAGAIPLITSGMAASRPTGSRLRLPWYLSCLARAHASVGEIGKAWQCLDQAMAVMATTKETWAESDLHRLAGELTLASPERHIAKAEAHFERALAVARAQQAKSWELRAATGLALLWRDAGKAGEARDLLRPICARFADGRDTRDRRDARALLADLEASN